jgi:hypothetical protein
MPEFDDEQLSLVSEELDMVLTTICVKYKMPPLAVAAITLARLIHLNNAGDSKEDFGKLLLSVSNSIMNDELDKPESLH